jgi:2'-5' RNA ligase
MEQPQGNLSKAWEWMNSPIDLGHIRSNIKQAQDYSTSGPTMDEAINHPTATLIKKGIEGFSGDAAQMLMTPLSFALLGAGTVARGTGAAAQLARAALVASGLGFGANAIKDAVQKGVKPNPALKETGYDDPKYLKRVLTDAAMATGGAAGVAEMGTPTSGSYGYKGAKVSAGPFSAEAGYRPAYRQPSPEGGYGEGSTVVPGKVTGRVSVGSRSVGTAPDGPWTDYQPVAPPAPGQAGAPRALPADTTPSGKPVVQASPDADAIRASAEQQHPTLKATIQGAIANIPGAELDGSRVKSSDSMQTKAERGHAPNEQKDVLGFRIAVETPADGKAVEQAIAQNHQVVGTEPLDSNGLKGLQVFVRSGKPGDAHQIAEIQILPKQQVDVLDKSTPIYEAQKEAEAAGDDKKAEALADKATEIHEQALTGEQPTKYKFGSSQVNLPASSDAAKAIGDMQSRIPDEDLAGDGKAIDKPHVTVRYGLKNGITPELRAFIEKQEPFEASLGPTTAFPPSEHSDGAAPIVAPVESPELHKLNAEIEKQADFEPSSFPDYKPHVSVAYVKPEVAEKYVGMKDAAGKTFPIDSIAISDKNGAHTEIPLKGGVTESGKEGGRGESPEPVAGEGKAASPATEKQEPTVPGATAEKSDAKITKGSQVTLPDGTSGTVAWTMGGKARVKTADGARHDAAVKDLKPAEPVEGVTSGTPGHDIPTQGAIAEDFDKTIAQFKDGSYKAGQVGAPRPAELEYVKGLLEDGKDVWIYTARAVTPEDVSAIKAWTKEHLGQELPVTNLKYKEFAVFRDDRSEQPKGEPDATPKPDEAKGSAAPIKATAEPERGAGKVEGQAKEADAPKSDLAQKREKFKAGKGTKVKRETAQRNAELAEHFTPGNVIHSRYWNSYDKVIDFHPTTKDSGWSVKVIHSDKDGNPTPGEVERTHSTWPDPKDKVVKRAEPAKVAEVAPKAESKPVELSEKQRFTLGQMADGKDASWLTQEMAASLEKKGLIRYVSGNAYQITDAGKSLAKPPAVSAEPAKESREDNPSAPTSDAAPRPVQESNASGGEKAQPATTEYSPEVTRTEGVEEKPIPSAAQELKPSKPMPRNGTMLKNYEGEYLKAALEPARAAWEKHLEGVPEVGFTEPKTQNGRKALSAQLMTGEYPQPSLKIESNRNGEYSVIFEDYHTPKGSQQPIPVRQVLAEGLSLKAAKDMAEARLRGGEMTNPGEPFYHNSREVPDVKIKNPGTKPEGYTASKLIVQVPGDGRFTIPNNLTAIEGAMRKADNFIVPREQQPKLRTPKAPPTFDNTKHIQNLKRQIEESETDLRRAEASPSGQGQAAYHREQLAAAKQALEEAQNPSDDDPEAGFLDISPLVDAAAPLREALEHRSEIAGVANNVHDVLQRLDRTNKATTLEAKDIARAFEEAGFTKADGDKVFAHLEDPKVKLTPKQEELRDKWIKPLDKRAADQRRVTLLIKSLSDKEAQKRRAKEGTEFTVDDILAGNVPPEEVERYAPEQPNYQHRIAVDKNTLVDRMLGGSMKRFRAGGSALSRNFSSGNRSVFYEIHGPDGQREAVAVKGGRVTQFRPGEKPEDLGAFRSGLTDAGTETDERMAPFVQRITELRDEIAGMAEADKAEQLASVQSRIADLRKQMALLDKVKAPVGRTSAFGGKVVYSTEPTFGQRAEISRKLEPLLKKEERLKAGTEPMLAKNVRKMQARQEELKGNEDFRDAALDEGEKMQGRIWVDKNGDQWKFDRGTTAFISQQTGQEYHSNAMLSSLVNWMETNKAMNAAVVMERLKGILADEGMAVKSDNPLTVPDGWKGTTLQQMRGMYFPAHVAETLDQFDYLQSRGQPNILERANRFIISSVLMNPLMHGKNIAANWFTGKAAEGITGSVFQPSWYGRNVTAGVKAVNTLRDLGGPEYRRLLRLGLDLQGASTSFDQTTKDILRGFTDQLAAEPEHNKAMSALLGVGDAAAWLQAKNHLATFGINDLFLLQSFYARAAELEAKGMPTEEAEAAARDWAHLQVAEYTTPVRVGGSAALGRLMENPNLSAFWRYHFGGILRPVMNAVSEAAGSFKPEGEPGADGKERNARGQTQAEARINALGRLAVLTAFAVAVYPKILDRLAKKMTHDEQAKAPRGGTLGFASNIYEMTQGERTPASVAGSVFTPALGTEEGLEAVINRDFFTGKHIMGTNVDTKTDVQQLASWLGSKSMPGQLTHRWDQGKGKQVLYGLLGFTFPMEHGLLEAAKIRSEASGSNPADPKEAKIWQSILAASEQARRSNGKDTRLKDALLHSGVLTLSQRREVIAASHETPIVFATATLDHDSDVWQVFEHSTAEEKRQLAEDPKTRRRMIGYERQLKLDHNTDEVAKVQKELAAAK